MQRNSLRVLGQAFALAGALAIGGNAFAYTQDYVTYWETSSDPGGGGRLWFDYVVFNTGTGDYSWTPMPDGREHVYNEIPTITSYLVPILTPAALGAIDTATIYQPAGWSYRFVDATADNWTNASGMAVFDHPYKLLEWYVPNPGEAPEDWSYWDPRYGIGPSGFPSREDVSNWMGLAPDGDPIRIDHAWLTDPDTGASYWNTDVFIHSEMIPPAFGFMSYTGKLLGPDETAWTLVTQDYILPLRPRTGDPDLPLLSNGIGTGGIPVPAPVPEPETYAMMMAGLGLMLARVRRRD